MYEYRSLRAAAGVTAEEVAQRERAAVSGGDGATGPSLFDRFGVPRPLGAWIGIAGARQPLFGYLLEWASLDQRDLAFPALWASPEWAAIEAGADHALVEKTETWLMGPSAAWELSDHTDARVGSLHEMRVHHVLAGFDRQVTAYLGEIEHWQMRVLGAAILGVFDMLIGPDMPAIVSFIAWPDFETQQRAAARLDVEPRVHERRRRWQAEHGRSIVRSVEQTLLRPVDVGMLKAGFGRRI